MAGSFLGAFSEADNGAWEDAFSDAGTSLFRGENGSSFEGGWRVPVAGFWSSLPAFSCSGRFSDIRPQPR